MILGGSTNAVLHLIAMAHSVGITLTIDDFQNVSDRTPFLADIKPSGKYVMEDVYKLGGIPSESFRRRFVQVYLFAEILHYLLKNNRIQGDNMTVTGKTLGENLDRWVHQYGELDFHTQRVIMPLDKPIKPSGHIRCVHVSSVRELFVPINHVRLNVIPIPIFCTPVDCVCIWDDSSLSAYSIDLVPDSFPRILKGNLAPGGAVAKITGKEGLGFTGKARTFDSEDEFVKAVENGSIKKGEKTVVILRYLGPQGGPG